MQAFMRGAALALAVAASRLPAQALPPAAELIAKHVTAIGGEAAVRKVTAMKQVATMELPGMGLSASMEMYSAAPNKSAVKTSIAGIGELLQGFDGTVAYDVNPMQGPRLLEGQELQQAKDNADFYAGLLLPASSFKSMETVGDGDFNGEAAWKVKLVRASSGREATHWFSKATGLMIGMETTVESQMGTIAASTRVSNYKARSRSSSP
jgi:hypothetical protein